jgi:3-oxoacyl-[acyl-carrier-protein] synthase II
MSSAASRPAGAPVAVSGSGVVSAIGVGVEAFENALFAGRSGVRAHIVDLPGIEVPAVPIAAADFDATAVIAPSRLPLDRATAMALVAADEAVRRAGLPAGAIDPERLGIFWGSGMAGASTFEMTCRIVYAERRRMRPTSVVTTMPNAPTAELALRFGARGAALAYACACASSAVAIGEAMRAIRAGWIDVAIAGGSESLLTPGVVASWQAMRVLAPVTFGDDAAARRACRPFAADRAGFALGEAAAAFVLESSEHVRARGAAAAWQLAGYATNCDGVHITNPDAAGQARAMRAALADAGVDPDAIGHVNAHGTATLAGDAAEATALASVFGRGGCR